MILYRLKIQTRKRFSPVLSDTLTQWRPLPVGVKALVFMYGSAAGKSGTIFDIYFWTVPFYVLLLKYSFFFI